MEGSAEVLLVGGTLVLLFGFVLGLPMAQARMKSPSAPRHLVTTHLEALMSGAALLGLSLAASYSDLNSNLELVSAWLLVGGVAATLSGGTLNWLQQVGDPFAEKPPGFLLQSVGGPVMLVGGVLLAVGVLMAI